MGGAGVRISPGTLKKPCYLEVNPENGTPIKTPKPLVP